MRAPITSTKHYVQFSPTTFAGAGGTNLVLAIGKEVQDIAAASTNEVRAGSQIKAIYVEFWLTSDDAAQSSCVWLFYKNPSAAPQVTASQILALHGYPNKHNILVTGQGLVAPNTQFPTAVFKGWIKIPKGKQRISLDEELIVAFAGIANGGTVCGFSTYKEYY